jgi:hypothetical protein
MKEKWVHVVWTEGTERIHSRSGNPHQMLWSRHDGCFVVLFRDNTGSMNNIPMKNILRWTEYDDAEVGSKEQAGSQTARPPR